MQLMKKKTTKILLSAAMVTLLVAASAMPAFAAGDVAGAIEQTWTQAQTQIKTVVNNVVFVLRKGRHRLLRLQKAWAV